MNKDDNFGNHPDVVRVLIVDDHEVLASSLAQVLDQEPDLKSVGVASSLERARAMIPTSAPDVLLLDHRLPDGDGVAAICELRALRSAMKIVILTASAADHVLLSAMQAGASGFLSKTRGLEEVTAAVRAAAAGEAVVSPELLARLLPKLSRTGNAHRDELTEREREVLSLVAAGLTNSAIAARLFVSVHTVRNHVTNLSLKLGAHSKLEALSIAVREGMLPGR
jgi:DNA-binding NarL/FixJ family response regulator